MNTHGDRALLITPSSITFATPDDNTVAQGTGTSAAGLLRVLTWSEAPDGRANPCRTETVSAEVFAGRDAAFKEALSPYRFGLQDYDPFQSLAASLDRAAEQGAGLSLAVWAALEADLFRFAFDHGFTAALDEARGTDDWLRFARLNALYRACVMAIAPLGIVPPAWNAWLRGDGKVRFPLRGLSKALERTLTRKTGSIATVVHR